MNLLEQTKDPEGDGEVEGYTILGMKDHNEQNQTTDWFKECSQRDGWSDTVKEKIS